MRLRYLAWAIFAVAVLLLAAFAGVAYERYEARTSRLQETNDLQSKERLREQKLAEAMRAIEAAWRMAIDHQYPLVSKCGDDGYAGKVIRHGAKLRADVKRTDTLINPYVGIVHVTGTIASNFNHLKANGGCFLSIDQALAANTDSDLKDIDQADYTFESVLSG